MIGIMFGSIDSNGRALIPVVVKEKSANISFRILAWIDTGFTGELVLPQTTAEAMSLPQSGVLEAELGDGSTTVLPTYTCLLDWFGSEMQVEVVATSGSALLGIGLLDGHKLTVDYRLRTVSIE